MNQDIKATQSSFIVDPALGVAALKPVPEEFAAAAEAQLAPVRIDSYDGLDKWLGSELKSSTHVERLKHAVEQAFRAAKESVQPFSIVRELKQAKQNLQAAKAKEFAPPDAQKDAIDESQMEIARLESMLRAIGSPKYARTVKALRNYVVAIQELVADKECDKADEVAHNAVLELESNLMPRVDNLYMGVPPKVDPLARIHLKQPFDAHARLEALRLHLDARSEAMDTDQEARVMNVANAAIFREVLGRAHELPRDGAVFFLRGGQIVRSREGGLLMIDVPRMNLGVGKEGAGLFRFIGQEDEIDGAALIKLKLKNGKPIPLKGSDPSNPKFAKEVGELIGVTPEWLKLGMTFGEVIKRFGQARSANNAATEIKNDEPKSSE